ncbi:diguanylate cyclase (GGDEF) domain-containing protein [Selenomonas ruminantium]|uniref:Diguanylate cyclase (GGDEF) domain-containing protein n=1 Tax=Selenomonas ruminantium TaxID=971 RepID=A0A1M6T1Q3_SELRU|nr:diguanylate cyclase [Selenomonas ruminantium]SHK50851.1 diguanylate cyclase (GGDEF) domain-containing protein [Selenomonas ruminantium]
MHSIRTKFTLLTVVSIIIAMSIATLIGVFSIKELGRSDADQMLHLKCTTGAMNLESYFDSAEHSTETVATLIQDNFENMPYDQLDSQVEHTRQLFNKIAARLPGVLTYYFRIDPQFSPTVKGFWYVKTAENDFHEYPTTDLIPYNDNISAAPKWFSVPKMIGKSIWLPPYYTENLGMRVISYNVPVYWRGQFVGVVGIELDYETLAREVEKIRLFDNGYAFLLDADSNIVYHPQMDTLLQYGEKVAMDTPDRIVGSNHVQYHFNGISKEAVWLPLRNSMQLYVTVPLSEINSGWQTMVRRILFASLVILLIVSLIMMRFGERITKPLCDLTESAKQVADGKYEFVLNYNGNDEIGLLTRTFKQLVTHTKEHISKLNRQVYIDAMTSVHNKASYEAYIQKLQEQIEDPAKKLEFAVGVFDCDNLKHINDVYGHDKGDVYIKTASQLICHTFKHSPVFRIGGDEFAVIIRNEDFQNRDELFRLFRQKREELCAAATSAWEQAHVTMGLAVYDAQIDAHVIDVARRADQCMYENKRLRKEKQRLTKELRKTEADG